LSVLALLDVFAGIAFMRHASTPMTVYLYGTVVTPIPLEKDESTIVNSQ